ncbi:magnesium transporter MgtE N-terminal domain-containing protein [Pseudoclavibacter sp. 13-3]|uniref:magnesium transporter MgtE N-terminal domain-containing protein n=1 Tax=Pseudoclavibacter sp. 13-3 TaxID=2901228 RepID=UPI001E3A86DC|nr:CBS domain-containing protein [Pseudoclavibacter sp. 13-3]
MTSPKIFVSRIIGSGVFDPAGDRVGRARDVIVTYRTVGPPVVVGLLVEVPGRRRVFLRIARVTGIVSGAIITTGLINLRRFEQRAGETRILAEIFGRTVRLRDSQQTGRIEDVSIEKLSTGEWVIADAFMRKPKTSASPFSRGETVLVPWDETEEIHRDGVEQDTTHLLASFQELQAPDLASSLMELPDRRREEVVENLSNERLADALEELGRSDQAELVRTIDDIRFAEVLDHMQPDDAADLVAEIAPDRKEKLLQLMEPEEASDVRMLLRYAPDTAGGLMTTEPVICSADTTVAEGLALIRRHEIAPALAAAIWVTLPPYEAPTGRYIGMVHFQRMLRYPPHERLGTLVDDDIEPMAPETSALEVARNLAAYNLTSIPVVDGNRRLLGVVTVDDVLDNLLPEDWRHRVGEVNDDGEAGEQ